MSKHDDNEMFDETVEELDELPPGVCPACDGLSPGISIDGETIMHCRVCNDTGKVTPEESKRFWEAVRGVHKVAPLVVADQH